MTPRAALERGLDEIALVLPAAAEEQLLRYVALLEKWNRVYNLTAIREPLGIITQHLLDSLAVLPHLPVDGPQSRVADAGSGAGLPGIPLAIARPQWHVALVEANQKKAAFLRQASIELGLANVHVHEARVESWHPTERFFLVLSRAFTELRTFVRACRHLVAPGGWLVAMKGKFPADELERVPDGFRCCRIVRTHTPSLDAERHLVFCAAA